MTRRSTEPSSSTHPYILAVAIAAAASLGGAVLVFGLPEKSTWFVALIVLGLLAGIGRPPAIGAIQFSTSAIVQLAAIPLVGPVGAAVIAALPEGFTRKEPIKRLFNTAQRVLLVLAASVAYGLTGGELLSSSRAIDPLDVALQMTVAALAGAIANSVLLAGVLKVSSGGSFRVVAVDLLRQALPAYGVYAVAGFMLAVLWAPAGMGWVSILFFLPSLVVIQWGLRQIAVEWAMRHQALVPFVTALDVRRPGAEEASRLAGGAAHAIATNLALRAAVVDEVTVSARLRNVGMLALEGRPAAIVRRDHASAAARVLGRIGFLSGPLKCIASHHERVDGQGRPEGLVGEAIPLDSRIVAVADTWGQAVMDGYDAEAATARCETLAGTALDSRCVIALQRALERGQLPPVGAST